MRRHLRHLRRWPTRIVPGAMGQSPGGAARYFRSRSARQRAGSMPEAPGSRETTGTGTPFITAWLPCQCRRSSGDEDHRSRRCRTGVPPRYRCAAATWAFQSVWSSANTRAASPWPARPLPPRRRQFPTGRLRRSPAWSATTFRKAPRKASLDAAPRAFLYHASSSAASMPAAWRSPTEARTSFPSRYLTPSKSSAIVMADPAGAAIGFKVRPCPPLERRRGPPSSNVQ